MAEEPEWKPDYTVTPRRIVCAARRKEGVVVTGARHSDKVIKGQMEAINGFKWWQGGEQGFIDQFGDFLTREEAWDVAVEQGQIRREVSSPGTLFSENIY